MSVSLLFIEPKQQGRDVWDMFGYSYLRWQFHNSDRTNVTEPPADVEDVEDASLMIWRPHGILDEAEVNKVLVDLIRRETTAEKPFNRFSDLSLVEIFSPDFQIRFSRRATPAPFLCRA